MRDSIRRISGLLLFVGSLMLLAPATSVVKAQYSINACPLLTCTTTTATFTTPILVPAADNCAAIPYSFTSDTNTGLCTSAADTWNLYTAGASRLSGNSTAVTSTVPVSIPDGAANAPSLRFATATLGFFSCGSGASICTTSAAGLAGTKLGLNFQMRSTGSIGFASTDTAEGALDTLFSREDAASFQFGADAATATAQTISAADSTGAGVAGASLTLSGGVGGTFGAQGQVIVDPGSRFVARSLATPITADAVVQIGQTVMPDAGTDGRFDVTTGNAALSIGVLGGVGASAAASSYPVVISGQGWVAPAMDQAITRGHYLLQSATAGYVNDSATVSTDGLNIALALYSEPVTNVIVIDGCGGGGCINTTTGVITLSANVATAGWTVGQPVIYWASGGAAPTGLTSGGVYFLASVSTTAVTISATYGGAAIVPSSQGNDSTQYLQRLPWSVVSIR